MVVYPTNRQIVAQNTIYNLRNTQNKKSLQNSNFEYRAKRKKML